MTTRFVRALFVASLLCSTAGVFTQADAAGPKISKEVGPAIQEAEKDLTAGDAQSALAKIKEAQAVADRTDYDNYIINRMLAFAYIKLNDYANATPAEEAAADSPAMPDEEKKSVLHDALLLSAQAKHYQKTITYGTQLIAMNGMDDQTMADMAIAAYETGDTAHAQQYAQQGISMAKAAGREPNPGLLQIVMNSQVKSNNQAGAEQTLEQLVQTSGDPQAFGQLIDVSLGTSGMNDVYFIDLMRLRILIGGAQTQDYLQLANQAYLRGYPQEAVSVLQKGGVSGGQAAEILRKARNDAATDERQLPAIAAAAAKSRTGEQDVKLAEDYWGYGRFADVEATARRAISKGGMKIGAEGPLILGMALAVQGKYDEALQTFSQVGGNQAAQKTAHLWTLYVQSKKGHAAPAQAPAH